MRSSRFALVCLAAVLLVSAAAAQVNPDKEYAPDENTVLLLHLNEGEGNPKDSSQFGHEATKGTGEWVAEGKHGACMSFEKGLATVKDAETLSCPDAMTVEMWIKPTAEDVGKGYHVLIHKGMTSATGNHRLYLVIKDGRLVNYPAFIGKTVLKADRWNHIAYVVTGTPAKGGKEHFFINGVLDVQGASSWPGLTQKGGFRIGGLTPKMESFKGLIDEVRVSKIARPYPSVEPAK